MNILHTEASRGWGGQEIRILSEIAAMQRRGHRVVLSCAPESELAKRAEAIVPGLLVAPLPYAGNFDIDTISGLQRLIRRHRIEVVNAHSSIDSWCTAIATLVTRGAVLVRTRHLSIPVKRNLPTSWLYRRPDAIVTTGEALRQRLIDHNRLAPGRVLSIPTGIDLTRFDPAGYDRRIVRDEFGIAEDEILIGMTAMMRQMKGHRVLIDAAPAILARHPRVRFLLIGHVTYASTFIDDLKARIQALGLTDRFLFAGYRNDIPQVLAALDLAVLPSIRDEGVPQSLTQALCMAKPVVATEVGAVGEIVRNHRTGLLVPPSDSPALATAIIAQLADPVRARTLGQAGRRMVVSHYGIESMADATGRLYERLLSRLPAWPDSAPSPHEFQPDLPAPP